ncbi:MAG: hypothetical protein M3Y09_00020 [Actinomycetota bacterium]|nr:hypothetical protein [Actinomycetota bacterium]
MVTSERIIFTDTKFAGGAAGGVLGVVIADKLQKRHEDGGPMLDLPLAQITGLAREKKMMNKDRMRVSTATEEYLFNDGWKSLGAVLREAFVAAGRQVVEQDPDRWTVQ